MSRSASLSASFASLCDDDIFAPSRSAPPSPPYLGPTSGPPLICPSLATRGLFFVTGGQRLGPTLTLFAATAGNRLCVTAMTGGGGPWPASTNGRFGERALRELVARVREMTASAVVAAEA